MTVDHDDKNIKWHSVSTLRDDEVDLDEDLLLEEFEDVQVPENVNALKEEHKIKTTYQGGVSAVEKVLPIVEITDDKNFSGQVFEKQSFVGKNLDGASFAGASLIGADFRNVSLKGVDFSGADLTGADFSGADLSEANLSGAILRDTVFNRARFDKIKLGEADLDGAFLLDLRIDEIGLEELQELVEFLAKNFPHKLNLMRINLKLLDLKRIDLSQLDLRGVDFTGVDFTGVNIIGLNLSECIITPQQIAQALGRPPTPAEMQQLMAPRKKNQKEGWKGMDWMDLFVDDGRELGVWDVSRSKGVSIDKIFDAGRKVFRRSAAKPKIKDEEILEQVKSEQKAKSDERKEKVLENIEKNKQAVLEARKERQRELQEKEQEERKQQKSIDLSSDMVRGRGGFER